MDTLRQHLPFTPPYAAARGAVLRRLLRPMLRMFVCLLPAACGGGGEDRRGEQPSDNACSDLGLPVKIINGTACGSLESAPIVRVIVTNSRGKQGLCSGTVATPRAVVTAAHCFVGDPVRTAIAYGSSLAASEVISADSWAVHPGLRPGSGPLVLNDVAVIHLPRDLPLPTVPILAAGGPAAGDIVSIFGYGTDEHGAFDFEDLKSGEMQVAAVTKSHIQANFTGDGSNTCLGDSGGPLLIRSQGRAALAGITSSGTQADCLAGDHSLFTNVLNRDVLAFLQLNLPSAEFLD